MSPARSIMLLFVSEHQIKMAADALLSVQLELDQSQSRLEKFLIEKILLSQTYSLNCLINQSTASPVLFMMDRTESFTLKKQAEILSS